LDEALVKYIGDMHSRALCCHDDSFAAHQMQTILLLFSVGITVLCLNICSVQSAMRKLDAINVTDLTIEAIKLVELLSSLNIEDF